MLQNEVIKTSADSASELVFRDDTTLTIGPNAEITLDTFVFDPDPAKGKVIINQTIGTIRFVSGKLAQAAYEIRTPTATIGIRGTVFTVTIVGNGTTTVSVTQGAVAVTNAAGVSQTVGSGLSSSVSPAPPGGTPPPPTPPGPPPANVVASVNQMNATVGQAAAGTGTAAGAGAAQAGLGGLSLGTIAIGAAVVAAAVAVGVAAAASDDPTPVVATTATKATTATQ